MKIVELPLGSRTEVLRRAPGEGAVGVAPLEKSRTFYENVRWTFESEQGRHSDWGLRNLDFEEILNDCSTNSLVLNNINSSN